MNKLGCFACALRRRASVCVRRAGGRRLSHSSGESLQKKAAGHLLFWRGRRGGGARSCYRRFHMRVSVRNRSPDAHMGWGATENVKPGNICGGDKVANLQRQRPQGSWRTAPKGGQFWNWGQKSDTFFFGKHPDGICVAPRENGAVSALFPLWRSTRRGRPRRTLKRFFLPG